MVQMADVRYTSTQFRSLAVEALGTFFEDRGFQRASTLEQETSLLGSIEAALLDNAGYTRVGDYLLPPVGH